MLLKITKPDLPHFSGTLLCGSGVVDHPIVVFVIKERSADEYHQMVRLSLLRLMEVQQVAGLSGARVTTNATRVESDQCPRIRKLSVARGLGVGNAKQRPAIAVWLWRCTDVGKCGTDRQAHTTGPFRRMRTQRLAECVSNERRAVGHLRHRLFELRIREENEPGSKRRPVGRVRESHLGSS